MATPAQKKHWFKVGLMMIIGAITAMVTVIKADDISNGLVWVGCIIGFGLFIGSFILLLGGTKG